MDARRWAIRERKSKEAAVRRCQECGAANATTAKKSPGVRAGNPNRRRVISRQRLASLIELSRERITFLAQQPHYCLRGMVLTEPEVRAIAREKGYKRGWAMHYMREQAERHAAAAVQ